MVPSAVVVALLALQLAQPGRAQFASLFCPPPTDSSQQVWPFPVNTSSVCSQLQLDQPNNAAACGAFALLESLLVGPSGNQVICNIGNQTVQRLWLPKDKDRQGRPLPQALPDRRVVLAGSSRRQLPPTLPAAVLDAEGATFNWLYKTLTMFARWAPCDALHTPTPWTLPHGWRLLKLANITGDLSQDGLSPANTSLPMLAVLQQNTRRSRWWLRGGSTSSSRRGTAGSYLIVLIRGTLTTFERRIDFNYNMVADARYGEGLLHVGFKSIADQLWDGGLQQVLDDEVLSGGGASSCDITFTGHSLGGGVATLLAARAQRYVAAARKQVTTAAAQPADPPSKPPLLVSAVLFAAPNVGNSTFAKDYNRRINGRNIGFAYDLVSQIPCKPTTTACANTPTPTDNPEGAWPYDRVGGVIQFAGQDMPLQPEAWRRLASYQQSDFCASADSLRWLNQAAHLCSYLCRTSVYVDDTENWCLLWPVSEQGFLQHDGQRATHCMVRSGRQEFPTNPLFPAMPASG